MAAIVSRLALLATCSGAPLGGALAAEIPADRAEADSAARAEADTLASIRALIQSGRYADAEGAARRTLASVSADPADSLPAADVMDLLVESLWRGGKATAPEARSLAELSLALKERARGPNDPSVAVSLFQLGNVLRRLSDYQGARSAFERALAIREKALGPDHPLVAQGLNSLGNLFVGLNDWESARPLYERSLAIRERALGPEHPDVAASLLNLAGALREAKDPEGAKALYERSLAIREKLHGSHHAEVARTLGGLAIVLQDIGDVAGARRQYERAIAIQEKTLGPDHPDVAHTLGNMASLASWSGDQAEARSLYERALAIRERALGSNHLEIADNLTDLGSVLTELGDCVAARVALDRALRVSERQLGSTAPALAVQLEHLAEATRCGGDLRRAEQIARRAVTIVERADRPDPHDLATALSCLGRILFAKGNFLDSRLAFERALGLRTQAGGPDSRDVARTLNELAYACESTGRPDLARGYYEKALGIWARVVGMDHPAYGGMLRNLADALYSLGDHAASLDSALRSNTIGRADLRLQARALPERLALQYESVGPGLDRALRAASEGVAPAKRNAVYDAVIRSRAVVLDEMAKRHRVAVGSGDPLADSLLKALKDASKRLAYLRLRGMEAKSADRHRGLQASAEKDKELLEEHLARRSVLLAGDLVSERAGLAEVARALPKGSWLVSFARYLALDRPHDRQGANRRPAGSATQLTAVPHYLAFVLPSGGETVGIVPLGPASEVDALASQWRLEATSGMRLHTSERAERAYRLAGEALRRRVWDPLAKAVQGASLVFVVPDGVLHLVNLSALPAGDRGYLVESGPTFHYLSAERDLVLAVASKHSGDGLLVVGGPDFDGEPLLASSPPMPQAPPNERRTYRGERSNCDEFVTRRFDTLPGTALEAEAISKLWIRGRAARATEDSAQHSARAPPLFELAGSEATESAFHRLAPGREVIHVATHGFFLSDRCTSVPGERGIGGMHPIAPRPASPTQAESPMLLSGLVLAGANSRSRVAAGGDDGILTAEEIASMDLTGVSWAVLSACETGVGEVRNGEGVLGLRRAFEVAGAGTLIMSLWSVEDQSTRSWMTALYEGRLVDRLSTAEAMREASVRMIRARRDRGQTTHPFFWGAFVAAGDWR